MRPSAEDITKLKRDTETVYALFVNVHLLDDAGRRELYQAAMRVHDTVQAHLEQLGDYR